MQHRAPPSPLVRISAASLCAALLAGCGLTPHDPVLLPSTDWDREAGANEMRKVEAQIGLCDLPALQAYVERVGARLAGRGGRGPFEYVYRITDQAQPNAFAAPGGAIHLSRGLLASLNSEDELAAVLSHEMAHVDRRHSARRSATGARLRLRPFSGRVAARVVARELPQITGATLEEITQARMASYGRAQELEADRIGIARAARAGYDPAALARVLERNVAVFEEQSGERTTHTLLDEHPPTPARTSEIRRRAASLAPADLPPLAPGRDGYLERIDGLPLGPNIGRGIFRDGKFLHPTEGIAMLVPRGWNTVLTPEAIGAVEPAGRAFLFGGGSCAGTDPRALARAFLAGARGDLRIEPVEERGVRCGDWPGHLVVLRDPTEGSDAHIFLLWIAKGGRIFRLIALGEESMRERLRESVASIRPLDPGERGALLARRLGVARALRGETIERLGARAGNAWPASLTAAVNDLPPAIRFAGGERVKIAIERPFSAPSRP